jgi:DNA gyrase/topoisomerase IV subunit A
MKDKVPSLYRSYGQYVNKFRSFPLNIDGLKIVERRLLYSLWEIAKEHYTKSAKVIGHCIGNYHGHGDQSAYGSLVGLVQNGLADGQGNWGSDIGIESCDPAAMRYTEVRCSKDVLKLSFEYIKYIDFEALEMDSEPVYLPTKLPFCLIQKNYPQGIGFGSRTYIPCYQIPDLVKRLKWLLGIQKTEPVIKPISDCDILSTTNDYKELLISGKGKIELQGKSYIDKKSVIINSVPPTKTLSKIIISLDKDITAKNIGWTDESNGKDGTKVRFTILRQRGYSIESLYEKIQKLLRGTITFECNMCDRDGKVILTSIDQMLLNTYNMYKNVVEKYFKDNIKNLDNKIQEMNYIQSIKKILPELLKTYPDNPDKIIELINTTLQIPNDTIKDLFEKYNINRLLKVKVDIEKVENDKKVFVVNLNNLVNYIWTEKYEGGLL